MTLYGICRREGQCVCGLCQRAAEPIPRERNAALGRKVLTCPWHGGKHKKSCYGYPLERRTEASRPPDPSLGPPYCGWCGAVRHQGQCKPARIAAKITA